MADVSTLETRLQVLDCSRGPKVVKNLPYMVHSMMLPVQGSVILQLLVDEATIEARLKTYLLDFRLCAQEDSGCLVPVDAPTSLNLQTFNLADQSNLSIKPSSYHCVVLSSCGGQILDAVSIDKVAASSVDRTASVNYAANGPRWLADAD